MSSGSYLVSRTRSASIFRTKTTKKGIYFLYEVQISQKVIVIADKAISYSLEQQHGKHANLRGGRDADTAEMLLRLLSVTTTGDKDDDNNDDDNNNNNMRLFKYSKHSEKFYIFRKCTRSQNATVQRERL